MLAQIPEEMQAQLKDNPKVLSIEYDEEFYPNGKIKSKGYYFMSRFYPFTSDIEGVDTVLYSVGEWKHYFKNGIVKEFNYFPVFEDSAFVYSWTFNKKGKKVWFNRYYCKEGIVPLEELVDDNSKPNFIQNSFQISFFNNGNIKWESNITSKGPVGEFKEYHRNGRIKKIINYNHNSLKDGDSKVWFQDGTLKKRGRYKEGLKAGVWEKYNKKGHLVKSKSYCLSPLKDFPH
ncbi:toxin-antitoxin system YwqK family antitoxin [Nafulsella turpanensis]|uniref:toxin-antitoxin system YwqK family antitoxin n=1 Tax=Nafulsella turpanensis TaxID=1265690 RepID=UPI00135F1311|nr:hypothetical protein [Nafulsella turpanensis]